MTIPFNVTIFADGEVTYPNGPPPDGPEGENDAQAEQDQEED